jgi:tetratricopeptide (TPR) repeat protein
MQFQILVYTHGKSEFRLVAAHHHMGLAYLAYRCYEQAIDHLTLALKKNSKLTHLQQTKLYHSVLLTSLSKCYFEIASYEDALEVLGRALEIQTVSYKELNEEGKVNVETLRLTACCHLKLKNPKKAHEYIKSALEYSRLAFGEKSIEVAKLKAETGKIFFEEKNYECAIEELNGAIGTALSFRNAD